MRSSRAYLAAVAVLVAGLVGYLVAHALLSAAGQARSPGASAPTATVTRTVGLSVSPGPAGSVDGIEGGFARTPRGAVAAAVNYLNALEGALLPRARWTWARVVRTLTTQPLEARALAGQAASERIAAQLARPGPSFMGSWPLGYRLLSFTHAHARVAVWTLGAMASPSGTVPASFSTTTCELTWTSGDWKVSDADATTGPTPPAAGSSGKQASWFVRAARTFSGFSDVP